MLDGESAALDVTMFTTNDKAAAGARAARNRAALNAGVVDAAAGRSVSGLVVYDIDVLRDLPKELVDYEAARLVAAASDAIAAVSGVAQNVPVPTGAAGSEGPRYRFGTTRPAKPGSVSYCYLVEAACPLR